MPAQYASDHGRAGAGRVVNLIGNDGNNES